MIPGILLALSSGGLFWRMFTERRLWSQLGHAVLSVAVMLSAFRRLVYEPGQMFGQVFLDHVVVWIFFAGSGLLVIDSAVRIWREMPPGGGHATGVFVRKLLWPLVVVPASVLLISAGLMSWRGDRSDLLSHDEAVTAVQNGDNVVAASARLIDLMEQDLKTIDESSRFMDQKSADTVRYRLALLQGSAFRCLSPSTVPRHR